MVRICHIITTLGNGGAERLLASFITGTSDRCKHLVIFLKSPSDLASELTAKGVSVVQLVHKTKKFYRLEWKLVLKAIKSFQPNICHCWMYHGMMAGVLLTPFLRCTKIIWSFHAFGIVPNSTKVSTRTIIRLLSLLSHVLPSKLTYCGINSALNHERIGYSQKLRDILKNGIDPDLYLPQFSIRSEFQNDHKIPLDAFIVGCVARRAPEKNHELLLNVANDLVTSGNEIYFVFCGRGLEAESELALTTLSRLSPKLHKYFIFLGEKANTIPVFASLDIHVLPSRSESFPLVLLEAMASEVYCIATDVGECASILEDCGTIIPVDDDKSLKNAILKVMRMDPVLLKSKKSQARQRVVRNFTLSNFNSKLLKLYASI